MKRIHFLIIPVIFSFFSAACKHEKNCSAFDSADIKEFPYKNPDTLIFTNETQDTFQIYISSIKMSEAYTFECKDLYNVCPCINFVEALATDTKNTASYSFLKMEQSDVSDMQYFKYNVRGFIFEFDFLNELPHIDQMEHLEHFASCTVRGTEYKDIIRITNIDQETIDIQYVYFNKEFGLLQFTEKSSGILWSIQN